MDNFARLNQLEQAQVNIWSIASPAKNKELHAHNMNQLSMPLNGTAYFLVEERLFIVPPQSAIIIPANNLHGVAKISEKTIVANIYLKAKFNKHLPKTPTSFPVTNLASIVINRICNFSNFDTPEAKHLIRVLFDEISQPPRENYHLVIPKHKVLYRIYQLFVNSQDFYPSLIECSSYVNLSERTILRLFKQELNTTFVAWKQQFLFIKALELLEKKRSTSQVAYKLGYNSESAFISMFKKISGGKTPKQYL